MIAEYIRVFFWVLSMVIFIIGGWLFLCFVFKAVYYAISNYFGRRKASVHGRTWTNTNIYGLISEKVFWFDNDGKKHIGTIYYENGTMYYGDEEKVKSSDQNGDID